MLGQLQRQKQVQKLAPGQMLGLKLLTKSLPDLRAEIVAEMERNPAIEDVDRPLETPLSDVIQKKERSETDETPDYPEDDFTPGHSVDEEAAERRQAFFDNQVGKETLQQHLLAQLPLSDIPRADWPMVEILVGDLNDNGFYAGSIPDLIMSTGRTEDEIVATLKKLTEFDPPGCGARTAAECLLAQLDAIPDPVLAETARLILENHIDDLAAGRVDAIAASLKIKLDQCQSAIRAIRTLNMSPGSAFPGEKDRIEYVNPEVHAVRRNGHWYAETDRRSLPEIKISKKFEEMLKSPDSTRETKAYVRERIAAARELQEAVAKRQETVASIAQAIFDRQQDFFVNGHAALKPMTQKEIAQEVGVSESTVSRTVCDKYALTPKGTLELRRFFVAGVSAADGTIVARDAVLSRLKALIDGEDKASPLSDDKLAQLLKTEGFPLARRTVAKYREQMSIPDTRARRAR